MINRKKICVEEIVKVPCWFIGYDFNHDSSYTIIDVTISECVHIYEHKKQDIKEREWIFHMQFSFRKNTDHFRNTLDFSGLWLTTGWTQLTEPTIWWLLRVEPEKQEETDGLQSPFEPVKPYTEGRLHPIIYPQILDVQEPYSENHYCLSQFSTSVSLLKRLTSSSNDNADSIRCKMLFT